MARIKYWRKRLGLEDWEVSVGIEAPDDCKADCEAEPPYKTALLRFDRKAIAPEELDAFVVHELLHLPVWALSDAAENLATGDDVKIRWIRDREEGLVTYLERLVLDLSTE